MHSRGRSGERYSTGAKNPNRQRAVLGRALSDEPAKPAKPAKPAEPAEPAGAPALRHFQHVLRRRVDVSLVECGGKISRD